MRESKPSALVVSHDPAFAAALSAALGRDFAVRLTEPATALSQHTPERVLPEVLVCDVALADRRTLQTAYRGIATLVLGTGEDAEMIEAVEAGALGYLPRDSPLRNIHEAVLTVAAGTAVIPPLMLGSLLRHVVERHRNEAASLARLDGLTPREREVFELAAVGLRHDEIGERIFISPATARTHLHRVFKKLDVHSKAELVALAASCGLPTQEEK